MKLIVGLGNPGIIYTHSRHNVGFKVIKSLAKIAGIVLKKDKGTFCLSAKCKFGGRNVILVMPLTFMNLSGSAIAALLRKYKVGLDSVLIVCDDLDLELGKIKIRPTGSSGGHRGLQSIIDSLGNNSFPRLRIGIGRPPHQLQDNVGLIGNWCGGGPLKNDAAEYVLSPFTKKEKEQIKDAIKKASECCRIWLKKGIIKSMNIFNTRSKQ